MNPTEIWSCFHLFLHFFVSYTGKVQICGWNFGIETIPGADWVRVTPIYSDWCITLLLSKNYTTLLAFWQFDGHHRKWSDDWEWKVKLVSNFWFVNEFHIALNQAPHQREWWGSSFTLLQVNVKWLQPTEACSHLLCARTFQQNGKIEFWTKKRLLAQVNIYIKLCLQLL